MSAIRIRKSRPTGSKDTTTHTKMQHDSTSNDTFTTDMPIISAAIARMRLPLIIGVVLIHCNVPELLRAWNGSQPDTSLWTTNAIGSISLLLDRTVTSVFFFISGFLFSSIPMGLRFHNTRKNCGEGSPPCSFLTFFGTSSSSSCTRQRAPLQHLRTAPLPTPSHYCARFRRLSGTMPTSVLPTCRCGSCATSS